MHAILLSALAATAVVLPPVSDDPALALVTQDRASALLTKAGDDVVHVKQVISMASRHGMKLEQLDQANAARSAAERLGVNHFAYGRLDGGKLTFNAAEVGQVQVKSGHADLPAGAAARVREASAQIARAMGAAAAPVQPDTSSDKAMAQYAQCYAIVIRQPISIEVPSVIEPAQLAKAAAACQDAVTEDPKFAAAWAALSLAEALSGEDEAAVQSLAKVKPEAGFVPLAILARFWLVTRYQSSQAGVSVLQHGLEQNPGFLLARAYLAELYNALRQHAKAAEAWREYLKRSPDNPYILTRMAYTLSRLGDAKGAVKISQQAVAIDPKSLELQLELASRYVDAGMLEKARATLEALSHQPEVLLRLGFVQYAQGDLDEARATLEGAFASASAPAEWRTRARSKYDLALVALKKGDKDRARALLLEAVGQGLKPRPGNDDEKALVALAKPSELVPPRKAVVREASPFTLDSGEIAPDAARPSPPKGFEPVK